MMVEKHVWKADGWGCGCCSGSTYRALETSGWEALQPGFSGPVFLWHLGVPGTLADFLGFGELELNKLVWLCKSNRTAGGKPIS